MSHTPELHKNSDILIVGAGIFGISTAYALASAGYKNITVIDRAHHLPAPDAASTDLNKVIRSEYADQDYHKLAREAIEEFKTPKWHDLYHNTGVICFAEETDPYAESIRQNATSSDALSTTQVFKNEQESKTSQTWSGRMPRFPRGCLATANMDGGWAAAGDCVARMMQWFIELGGTVVSGQKFSDFIYGDGDDETLVGVKTAGGKEFRADHIVLAVGAWTEKALEKTKLALPHGMVQASGQCIAAVQLDEELVKKHQNNPVIMNLATRYYMFPPNKDGLVKFVFHAPGYLNIPVGSQVSVPRTALSVGAEDGAIPLKDQAQLRQQLNVFYPDLAALPLAFTRVCYYTDTLDGNFIIDRHHKYKQLLFATGGSGHAFKFASVLPKYMLEKLEGRLAPHLVQKWAFKRDTGKAGDGNRNEVAKGDFRKADWEKPQDWEAFDKSWI